MGFWADLFHTTPAAPARHRGTGRASRKRSRQPATPPAGLIRQPTPKRTVPARQRFAGGSLPLGFRLSPADDRKTYVMPRNWGPTAPPPPKAVTPARSRFRDATPPKRVPPGMLFPAAKASGSARRPASAIPGMGSLGRHRSGGSEPSHGPASSNGPGLGGQMPRPRVAGSKTKAKTKKANK